MSLLGRLRQLLSVCPLWFLVAFRHIQGSRDVLVDGVRIFGDARFPNNDGIDPDSSINVTIRNSQIDVADDGICPKATAAYGPLLYLHVHNCSIRSKCGAHVQRCFLSC
jgi:polygalacturonase